MSDLTAPTVTGTPCRVGDAVATYWATGHVGAIDPTRVDGIGVDIHWGGTLNRHWFHPTGVVLVTEQRQHTRTKKARSKRS